MKITFKGNIGKDAQLTKTADGTSVCSFWVAENITKRDKSKETRWHKVTIWRNYADTMAPWLKKGRRIEVSGIAKANFYTNKNSQVVPFIDVWADELELLDAPNRPEGDVPPEVAEEENAAVPAQTVQTTVEDEMPW